MSMHFRVPHVYLVPTKDMRSFGTGVTVLMLEVELGTSERTVLLITETSLQLACFFAPDPQTWFLSVALAILKSTLYVRLASNSEIHLPVPTCAFQVLGLKACTTTA